MYNCEYAYSATPYTTFPACEENRGCGLAFILVLFILLAIICCCGTKVDEKDCCECDCKDEFEFKC